MTEVTEARITSSFGATFTTASIPDEKIILFNNLLEPLKNSFGITENTIAINGMVEEFYGFSEVPNMPEVPYPNISDSDPDYIKRQKSLDLEWKSPRIHLNIWMAPGISAWAPAVDNQNWIKVGMHSILNNGGYPYTRYRPLDMLTDNLMRKYGRNARLAVSLTKIGEDYLKNSGKGNDVINIEGTVTQEVVIFKQFIPLMTNNFTTIATTVRRVLIEANANRTFLQGSNLGTTAFIYKLGGNVTTSNFDGTVQPGASIPGIGNYKGLIDVMTTAGNTTAFAQEQTS